MAFIFWGIIGTIGPLVASGAVIGSLDKSEKIIFLLVGPLTVPVGNIVMGILSDHFGRKRIFMVTMSFYTIGIIIISLSYSVLPLLLGLVLAEFGVGGEEPSSLALMGEESTIRSRPKFLTLMTNFDNVGSALMAGLFFIVVVDIQDRIVLLIGSLILIISMLYLRLYIPESKIWKKYRTANSDCDSGKALHDDKNLHGHADIQEGLVPGVPSGVDGDSESAETTWISGHKKPGHLLVFVFLGVIAVSQYLTFGLMAYVLAPIEFPNTFEDTLIIFVAMCGASVAGFIAAPLITRGTKKYTLYAFLFGTVTMVIIITVSPVLSNMFIFLPLLFANMFASEFAYASRSVLEPELFGTKFRSTFIGITRLWPMIAYPIFTFYTSYLNLRDFLMVNLILWGMGFVATVVWYILGIETKNMSLDYVF